MRILPTVLHGLMEYLLGLALIAAPWVFGFAATSATATWTALGIGGAVLLQAMLTDFEVGALHLVPMPLHVVLEGLLGLFLAASPWLLDYDRVVWAPHFVAGLLLVLLAMTGRLIPSYQPPLTDWADPGAAPRPVLS